MRPFYSLSQRHHVTASKPSPGYNHQSTGGRSERTVSSKNGHVKLIQLHMYQGSPLFRALTPSLHRHSCCPMPFYNNTKNNNLLSTPAPIGLHSRGFNSGASEARGGPPTTCRVTPRNAGLLDWVNIGQSTKTWVTPGNPVSFGNTVIGFL